MAFLLALNHATVDPEVLTTPGITGLVVPVPISDLQSKSVNASLHQVRSSGLELYCVISNEGLGSLSTNDAWDMLGNVQAALPFAKLVLPFHSFSLQLLVKAAAFGWNWHVSISSITELAMALSSTAGGLWISVGELDGEREHEGDELCTQVSTFLDEQTQTSQRPMLVAADIRDRDHAERMLLYGCNRAVVTETVWSSLLSR